MKVLPNFFPHVYNINCGELPLEDHPFEKIFRHNMNSELGTGSTGTIVYKGKLGDREIAIKRVVETYSSTIAKEISELLMNNNHPNILRYYAHEVDMNYFFIGAEMCDYNLATFTTVESWRQMMATKRILLQSAKGLNYLHKLEISYCSKCYFYVINYKYNYYILVHRNLKPENILILKGTLTYSVKLADFGISKNALKTPVIASEAPVKWIAPEMSSGTNEHVIIFEAKMMI